MVKILPKGPATTPIEYIVFIAASLLVLHVTITFTLDVIKRYL